MKIKLVSILLIGVFVFTSLSVFAADVNAGNNQMVAPAASSALFLNNFNMEYCTVSLSNPRSNLNVRTWEGRVVGKLRHGTNLQTIYFDQTRAQLDPEARVVDCVGEGKETVTIGGTTKHVMGYLQDFLFPAERARSPVKSLSGGERARLLLAQLFTKPANVLVMDEPTNDLDIETLELLEELLLNYDGTLFLVSHDRAFLDNVVTSCLAFEGDGSVREVVGGYSDWLRQRAAPPAPAREAKADKRPAAVAGPKKPAGKKLSYKDQRELEQLPARIEQLEKEQTEVQARLADPELYRRDPAAMQQLATRLQDIEAALRTAYARWQALEAR